MTVWENGTARTASVPWHEPYPPTILIGKTGFTPGFWEWLTSGAACIAVNMATVPCHCSFPSKVTTRAPSAAVSSLPNYRGASATIWFSQKSVRYCRRCHNFCSSISMSSIRFHHRCSRDFWRICCSCLRWKSSRHTEVMYRNTLVWPPSSPRATWPTSSPTHPATADSWV